MFFVNPEYISKERYDLGKLFESNEGHTNVIVTKLDLGYCVEDILSEIKSITPEQVQETARKYLPRDREGVYALLIRDPLKES